MAFTAVTPLTVAQTADLNDAAYENSIRRNFGATFGTLLAAIVSNFQPGNAVPATLSSAAVGATVALTAAQTGAMIVNRSTSGSPKWTLPPVVDGIEFIFVTGNTTAGFVVQPQDAAVIHLKTGGTTTSTGPGTVLTTTASTGVVTNTQATAVVGDRIRLRCDGVAWWAIEQDGIFAAT